MFSSQRMKSNSVPKIEGDFLVRGSNIGQTTAIDSINGLVGSRLGTASIVAGGPYNDGCLSMLGIVSGFEFPSTASFQLGLNDFTFESWINQTSNSGYRFLMCSMAPKVGVSGGAGWMLRFMNTNTFQIYYVFGSTSWYSQQIYTSGSLPLNQWYHFCAMRVNGILHAFINGVHFNHATLPTSINFNYNMDLYGGSAAGGVTRIGCNNLAVPGQWLNGYMDDVRLTNGKALYPTSGFTVEKY
jgi:hypothetical protein